MVKHLNPRLPTFIHLSLSPSMEVFLFPKVLTPFILLPLIALRALLDGDQEQGQHPRHLQRPLAGLSTALQEELKVNSV